MVEVVDDVADQDEDTMLQFPVHWLVFAVVVHDLGQKTARQVRCIARPRTLMALVASWVTTTPRFPG